MNREIYFRGKREDTGEWIYGSLCVNPYETSIMDLSDVTYGRYDVDPDTVGQYIGLRDRDQIRIYEGDIIAGMMYDKKCPKNTCVMFDERYAVFKGQNGTELIPLGYECEVIGNRHDNPELLK